MTTNEHLDRIRNALRSNETDTPLGQAVARLKKRFVLGDGGPGRNPWPCSSNRRPNG